MTLKGIEEGATFPAGGLELPDELRTGFYVCSTNLTDTLGGMSASLAEIFGPIPAIIPIEREDEALRLADDTPYGLGAQAHSTDTERCAGLEGVLRAGMVVSTVRTSPVAVHSGDVKQSGDSPEGGVFGIEGFLEMKINAWIERIVGDVGGNAKGHCRHCRCIDGGGLTRVER